MYATVCLFGENMVLEKGPVPSCFRIISTKKRERLQKWHGMTWTVAGRADSPHDGSGPWGHSTTSQLTYTYSTTTVPYNLYKHKYMYVHAQQNERECVNVQRTLGRKEEKRNTPVKSSLKSTNTIIKDILFSAKEISRNADVSENFCANRIFITEKFFCSYKKFQKFGINYMRTIQFKTVPYDANPIFIMFLKLRGWNKVIFFRSSCRIFTQDTRICCYVLAICEDNFLNF